MAGAGAVAFNFQRKGQIVIQKDKIAEDQLMELVLNAGGDDLQTFDTHYEVLTTPNAYAGVVDALNKAKLELASSEIAWLPTTTVPLSEEDKVKLQTLTEALEELDDVQYVWTNLEE